MTRWPASVPWSTFTWVPLPPAQPARTTVPAAAAPTGVPQGAARSRPVCSFQTWRTGWNRMPKREVLRPWMGMDSSVPDDVRVTDGMGAVGTLEGRVRTIVSSPGGSSGGASFVGAGTIERREPDEPAAPSASLDCPTSGVPTSSEIPGRSGWAVLTDNGEAGWPTGATGTAVSSPGWLPAATIRPTASNEDTAATSDLIPCTRI